jgi:hypothetical protein
MAMKLSLLHAVLVLGMSAIGFFFTADTICVRERR